MLCRFDGKEPWVDKDTYVSEHALVIGSVHIGDHCYIGHGVILRGGTDALYSNLILTGLIRNGLKKSGLPEDCVAMVENTKRESVLQLVRLKDFIDVIIPRGGFNTVALDMVVARVERFLQQNQPSEGNAGR